jgi:hypothetical protein
MAASLGNAVRSATITRDTFARPAPSRKAFHAKPGAALASSTGVIGL